jgi:hypothetical protein
MVELCGGQGSKFKICFGKNWPGKQFWIWEMYWVGAKILVREKNLSRGNNFGLGSSAGAAAAIKIYLTAAAAAPEVHINCRGTLWSTVLPHCSSSSSTVLPNCSRSSSNSTSSTYQLQSVLSGVQS